MSEPLNLPELRINFIETVSILQFSIESYLGSQQKCREGGFVREVQQSCCLFEVIQESCTNCSVMLAAQKKVQV